MNQTDTPRTNAAINASGGQWSFVLLDCSSELERELTAAREKLAKAGVGDYKADYFLGELTETGKLRSELKAVTEQRDRLVEALRKAILWGDSASHHIFHRQNINWTYLNEAKEALQSLNQPTKP